MTTKNDFDDFIRLIGALEPWLPQIVIVGGWAHRLYRFHDLAQPVEYKPLMTFDMDVAVPTDLPVEREDIAQRLDKGGFTETLLGDHQPPVTRYQLGTEDQGFYAEFLTPLFGSGYTREGQPDQTVRIAGVSSQKLRHLEVVLKGSWPIVLVPSAEVRIAKPAIIDVANPTAYIVQKLLIRDKRDKAHRAKDLLYIHDTIELFGAKLERLHEVWNEVVLPGLHRNQVEKLRHEVLEIVSGVNDITRDASLPVPQAGL
jgi:hypothetical protein